MESAVCLIALAALLLSIPSDVHTGLPLSMEHFIRVIEKIEDGAISSAPLAVVRHLRRTAGIDDDFIRYFLHEAQPARDRGHTLGPMLTEYVRLVVRHGVTDQGGEMGVVLGDDGTTVALAPVLLGIEAGLSTGLGEPVPGLYSLTLARNLGLSFLRSQGDRASVSQTLGPDGCWDNVTFPKVFTLSGQPSLATDALINGGMDGVVLGQYLSEHPAYNLKLSTVLREYYSPHSEGPYNTPRLVSALRRDSFARLVNSTFLQKQVVQSLSVLWSLNGGEGLAAAAGLENVVKTGVQQFVHKYMECPAIIPRCQWGARPYRGTPTPLKLPLAFMYIHHTKSPSDPCISFRRCAADMRAMQRFHQDIRRWDDIGYSFVAGSDGYIYEGRGWEWRGAHTRGQNSRGYGVSFIGDYHSTLPTRRSLELVRERLVSCGVGGGRLVESFTWHGHRQLVNTNCPGDALYTEIQRWKQFRDKHFEPIHRTDQAKSLLAHQAEFIAANQSETATVSQSMFVRINETIHEKKINLGLS